MRPYERDFYVYKIMSGYTKLDYNGIPVRIYPPTPGILYDASLIYQEVYDKCLDEDIITEDDLLSYLYEYGVWNNTKESDLSKAITDIENFKVAIYENCFKSETRKEARRRLNIAKDYMNKLLGDKHSLDYLTCEGIASFSKWQYIIIKSLRDDNGKKIPSLENIDVVKLLSDYHNQTLTDDTIRELSRTEPWSQIWSTSNKSINIFKIKTTEEQKRLIAWSRFYDSIYKSHECPHESIIEDDDMLDGWVIKQRREREADLAKKQGNELLSKTKAGGYEEVFLVAETFEDAKRINQLNDPVTQQIKKSRFDLIEKKGSVSHMEFTDMKLKLMEQIAAARTKGIKGK